MSISDAETLGVRLEGIREAGHEISVGELDPNIFSIAALVRDHTGVVIAALGVNGPTGRLSDGVQENILAALLFNAGRLSRMLGWHGDSVIIGDEKAGGYVVRVRFCVAKLCETRFHLSKQCFIFMRSSEESRP